MNSFPSSLAVILALSAPMALAAQGGGAANVAAPAQIQVARPNPEQLSVMMALARHLNLVLKPEAPLLEGEEMVRILRGRSPRMLAPEILPISVSGELINRGSTTAVRDSAETAALAEALGGQVATPADTIWCAKGECHGTFGAQLRFNQPSIVGDSAMMAYSFLIRNPTGQGLPNRINRIFVVLKKVNGDWQVTWNRLANQDRLSPLPSRTGGR